MVKQLRVRDRDKESTYRREVKKGPEITGSQAQVGFASAIEDSFKERKL